MENNKQETIEEAADKATNYYTYPDIKKYHIESFIRGVKWQMERSYSEEDMLLAFIAGVDKESYGGVSFDMWFEQFKKK